MGGGLGRGGLLLGLFLIAAAGATSVLGASGPEARQRPSAAKPAAAKPTAKPARPSSGKSPARGAAKTGGARFWGPFRVTGSFDFQTIYDDNIFRYSGTNLIRWRNGEYRPGEFNMDTFDDFILSPRLNLNLAARLLGPRESTIRLSYIRWQYASNPSKSNESWAVRVRQPVTARGFTELSYTFAPMALIRPLGDRAPFDPFSNVEYAYYPFRSSRNAFALAWQHRLHDRFTLRLEGGRVIRYYNQRFIENDNWEWNAASTGTFSISSAVKATAKYMYSDVKARAIDVVGEQRLTSDDGDPSYKRDLYQVSFDFSSKRGIWIFNLWEISQQYMAYYFTSEQPYWIDPTHVGRKDQVYATESTLGTRPVWGPVTLEIGYRFSRRFSSSGAAADLEEDKNYHDNRYWLGMSYPF